MHPAQYTASSKENSLKRAACTIVSPNYVHYARVLAQSYLSHHPDHRFFVCIVADLSDPTPFLGGGFEPVMISSIGLPHPRATAMMYDVLELNTNVKPSFLRHLFVTFELDQLVFLDPDIFIYSKLEPIFSALDAGATAVLTPHMTTPIWDGKRPGEQELLYNGTYNLGFIALSKCAETDRLLDWWEIRVIESGFAEGRTGLFVDQKWANLMPALFDRISIVRDAGLNMAYWNIHERTLRKEEDLYVVEGSESPTPLRFFHFSGVVADDPAMLSKNTNRYTLADRSDLLEVFRNYNLALLREKAAAAQVVDLPYGFNQFSDGTAVTTVARRFYAVHRLRFGESDPFDADGPFLRWAKTTGLVKGKVRPAKASWSEFDPNDKRVRFIHSVLRLALRVLGSHRYEALIDSMGHFSILRNQAPLFRDPNWLDDCKS
jgi:hypothetical protein